MRNFWICSPSSGVPFKIIGEVGVVGVLFADITMYLHLKLSGRTALDISYIIPKHTVVTLGGDTPIYTRSSAYMKIRDPTETQRDASLST